VDLLNTTATQDSSMTKNLSDLGVCTEFICTSTSDRSPGSSALQSRFATTADYHAFSSQASPLGMGIDSSCLWDIGQTITVGFDGGRKDVRAKVEKCAKKWEAHANITFKFLDPGQDWQTADIRIKFMRDRGSYCYVGRTGAKSRQSDEETMNLGWLHNLDTENKQSDDEEFNRVTLHEFGHALGCIHEHAQPLAPFIWDVPAIVGAYLNFPAPISGPYDSEYTKKIKERLDSAYFNVIEKYSVPKTQFSKFDPNSIMIYPIPSEWIQNVNEASPVLRRPHELSETDKSYIQSLYPFTVKPSRPPRRHTVLRSLHAHIYPSDNTNNIGASSRLRPSFDMVIHSGDRETLPGMSLTKLKLPISTEDILIRAQSKAGVGRRYSTTIQVYPSTLNCEYAEYSWLEVPLGEYPNVEFGSFYHRCDPEGGSDQCLQVDFPSPFPSSPQVVVFLNQVYLNRACYRVGVEVTDIDPHRFAVKISSFATNPTTSVELGITWIAFLFDSELVTGGVFSNKSKSSGRIDFRKSFQTTPVVLAGLSSIYSDSINIDVTTRATTRGINWNIDLGCSTSGIVGFNSIAFA